MEGEQFCSIQNLELSKFKSLMVEYESKPKREEKKEEAVVQQAAVQQQP